MQKTRESLPYIAPDLLGSANVEDWQKIKGDMWSLAITAIHLATGQVPYDNLSSPAQITIAIRDQPGPSLIGNFSSDFIEIIHLSLEKDPTRRPTVDDLLKHRFFKNAGDSDFLINFLNNIPPSVDWSLQDSDLGEEDINEVKGSKVHFEENSQSTDFEPPNVTPEPERTPKLLNVPIQSYIGEKDNEYYIYIRTIPSTKIQISMTYRTLIISGTFPIINIENEVTMHQPVNAIFRKIIEFEEEVDYRTFYQTLNRETSTMVIRISKFYQRKLNSEIVF